MKMPVIVNNYFPESLRLPGDVRVKVSNLESPRTGSPVKNQFVVWLGWSDVRFQSYETTCLKYDYDCQVLTVFPEAFGYSVTTSKYSRQWLQEVLSWSGAEVDELRKLVKASDFGRDCPLHIKLEEVEEI